MLASASTDTDIYLIKLMDDFISGRRTFFAIALTTQENLKNICLLIPLTETKELQYTCPQIRD